MNRKYIALLFACLGLAVAGRATVIWHEGVDGGFSHDFATATALPALDVGSNTLHARVEIVPSQYGWTTYADYFTFTVSAGTLVNSVALQTDDTNLWIWIGTADFSTQLGFVGFMGAGWGLPPPANGELLPQMALSELVAGTYGMYVANMHTDSVARVANYSLEFNVATAPVPDSGPVALLAATAVVSLAIVRRRRGN